MKMLISTILKKIPARNTKHRASICKHCGTRIYSLAFLKVHLESHKRKTANLR